MPTQPVAAIVYDEDMPQDLLWFYANESLPPLLRSVDEESAWNDPGDLQDLIDNTLYRADHLETNRRKLKGIDAATLRKHTAALRLGASILQYRLETAGPIVAAVDISNRIEKAAKAAHLELDPDEDEDEDDNDDND